MFPSFTCVRVGFGPCRLTTPCVLLTLFHGTCHILWKGAIERQKYTFTFASCHDVFSDNLSTFHSGPFGVLGSAQSLDSRRPTVRYVHPSVNICFACHALAFFHIFFHCVRNVMIAISPTMHTSSLSNYESNWSLLRFAHLESMTNIVSALKLQKHDVSSHVNKKQTDHDIPAVPRAIPTTAVEMSAR